jgi:hypothetical protein
MPAEELKQLAEEADLHGVVIGDVNEAIAEAKAQQQP